MVLAFGGGLGGDEGRVLQGRFHGVLPRTLQRFGALGGQPGVSTPNCFACSAFNRCQPPNFMASAPTMRPTGSPARSRSRTSKQMCQPAAPHEIKRRSVVPEREARAAAGRLELPPEVAATPAVLEQPRRLGPLHGGLGDLRRRRSHRGELHRGCVLTVPRLPSASKGAHSRRCAGSVSACQTFSGEWCSSLTRMSVHFSPSFRTCTPLAGPGVYGSRSIIFCSLSSLTLGLVDPCGRGSVRAHLRERTRTGGRAPAR